MRQIMTITRLQFQLVFKSGAGMIMLLVMPLILTLIFGVMIGGQQQAPGEATRFPVALVNDDLSQGADLLIAALEDQRTLKLSLVAHSDLPRLFADREIVSAIVIPAGFEQELRWREAPEIAVIAAPGANLYQAITPTVMREASRIAIDYRLAVAMAAGGGSAVKSDATAVPVPVTEVDDAAIREAFAQVSEQRSNLTIGLEREVLYRPDAPAQQGDHNSLTYASLGFTVMFVMMLVFMQSGVILQERQNGTWGRLLITPVSRTSLLTGYLLSFFVIGMAQFGLLVGATRLLFGISWGSLLPLFGMAAAFVLCSSALGLFVAGWVRTAEQQRTFGSIAVVATSMLGGVYWPLEFVGETMQRIGYLTPQAWAMMGFTEVMLRGGSFSGLLWPLAVLLSLTVVFMTIGLLRVRFE